MLVYAKNCTSEHKRWPAPLRDPAFYWPQCGLCAPDFMLLDIIIAKLWLDDEGDQQGVGHERTRQPTVEDSRVFFSKGYFTTA